MAEAPELFWEMLKTAPLAGVFGLIWWMERAERREKERLCSERIEKLEETVQALATQGTTAIQRVYDLLNAARKP